MKVESEKKNSFMERDSTSGWEGREGLVGGKNGGQMPLSSPQSGLFTTQTMLNTHIRINPTAIAMCCD